MKIFFQILLIILLNSCSNETIFIEPDLPSLHAPKDVKHLNTFIRKGCLFINDHNSSLCGNDLKIILNQFNKYKINQETCKKIIKEYNDYKYENSKNI